MPTARELLEQADALMRRNRADQVDDIPVLTDAVPSLAEAPIRAVAATPAAAPADVHFPPGPGSGALQPRNETAAEGEPSDWLEIEDAEPSVIGEAPDSVAIVPPVELRRAADEALLQSAEHEEIELTSPADDRFDVDPAPAEDAEHSAPAAPPAPADIDEPREIAPPATVASREADGYQQADASEMTAPAARSDDASIVEIVELAEYVETAPVMPGARAPAAGAGELDAAATPAREPAPVSAAIPSAAVLAASFAAAMPAETVAPASLGPDTRWPATAAPMPEVPPPDSVRAGAAAPEPPGPDDRAHWDSVAEEVRMQVLQRIDLFTDTGLREQLGERLKPIVDRASADLVATINQHVGELLRAYVAEAIEREIERWRRDN